MWLYTAIVLMSMIGDSSVDKGPVVSVWQASDTQVCYIVADENGEAHEYCVSNN